MSRPGSDAAELSRLIDIVLDLLPLHAEEGGRRDSVAVADIANRLAESGVGDESASLLIGMLTRQMDALALLDRVALMRGYWTFVSFPASLLGRILLETLSAPTHAILPPDYWEQGDHRPPTIKEEQRRLLHRIESARVRLNATAKPVRVVHVAWAAIRMHNKFLLHRREDIFRPGEKTYVLPGGRFNLNDLPDDALSSPDILKQVFQIHSPLVNRHIDSTLTRELHEELGLCHGEHYSFRFWQTLPPYRQVNGAGNRHAYSEYDFHLYTLQLTPLGEVLLLNQEATSSTLAWFSPDEIAAPQRADGESAFVDVLHASWGKDLALMLTSVPESSPSTYGMVSESEMLDLPSSPDAGFQFGKPGKERSLSLQITDEEWQLMILLGWHLRGFSIDAIGETRLLTGGWIRLGDEMARTVCISLQKKISKALTGLVEIRDGHYFSLRISPEILMFSPGFYSYKIDGSNSDGGILTVARKGFRTPWGNLIGDSVRKPITGNTVRILRELERGDDPAGSPGVKAGDWEKNLRVQLADLKSLGLRRFWTTKQNSSSLVDGLQRMGSSTGSELT